MECGFLQVTLLSRVSKGHTGQCCEDVPAWGQGRVQQRPHADDSSNMNMAVGVRGYKDREVRPRAQGKEAKTKMGFQLPGALNSLDNTGNQPKPRKAHTECHSQRPLPRGLTQSPQEMPKASEYEEKLLTAVRC